MSAAKAVAVSFRRGAQVTDMVLWASSLTGLRRSNAATTSASVTSSAFFIQSHANTSSALGRCIGSLCTSARNSWSSSGDTRHPGPMSLYRRSIGASSLERGAKCSPRPRRASAMLCLILDMRPTPVRSNRTRPAAQMSADESRYMPSSAATTDSPIIPPRTASAGKIPLS